ncbi:MAG: cupin domain-containing protein [Reyranella sp.]
MTDEAKWRTGVTVVRAAEQEAARLGGTGRATVVDYAGTGGQRTWIGTVTLQPKARTGTHHHGRHEVTIYVVKGRSEIRWGERLEFAAEVGPGDFVYFAPYVPHQELNLDADKTADFVVVRSDNDKIVVPLDDRPVERPEMVY